MDTDFALPAGTMLAGEYRIDGVLGAGGFGITYRARDVKLDVDVAIKEYFPGSVASRLETHAVKARTKSDREQFDWGLEKFLDEAKRLARLSHPNIVRCSRFFAENDTGYFVMSFEQGQTLSEHFAGKPQQRELDEIVEPLLNALETLHAAGIYHRDIAPDNILVRDNGTPVLLDFGASRQEFATRSRTLAAIVKPGYSPIEQYDTTTRQQGAWSDIYAFAATLYAVVCGAPPPEATARIRDDAYIPARQAARGAFRMEFLDAIDWGLKLHPDERPGSIREWRRKLLAKQAGSGQPAATEATRLAGGAPGRATAVTRMAGAASEAVTRLVRNPTPSRTAALLVPAIALVAVLAYVLGGREAADDNKAAEAGERAIAAFTRAEEASWKRIRTVLKGLGHVDKGTGATTEETRAGLKLFQTAIGEKPTGYLTERLFNRIVEEQVEFAPYNPPNAAPVGRWFTELGTSPCHISTAASRLEGRTLATERPITQFGVRSEEKDRLLVDFLWSGLFDTSQPVTFVSGSVHHNLLYDGEDFLFGKESDGSWSHAMPIALRLNKGDFMITGTSALGGALRLTFSAEGFEEAFRAMDEKCGGGLLSFIETWAGVVYSEDDEFFWANSIATEADASAQAMNACTEKHGSDKCTHAIAFKEECFGMARGVRKSRKEDELAWKWVVRATADDAKTDVMNDCASDGWKDCELNVTVCSDGSGYFNKTN